MKKLLVLVVAFLALAAVADAQTAINPKTVEFTASTDHAAMIGDQAVLTRYDLRIFLSGATQPFQTFDLGKPTPDGTNKISVTNTSWFIALALNTTYTAKVAAIGPAGEGVSDASNPFGNAGAPNKPGTPAIKQ